METVDTMETTTPNNTVEHIRSPLYTFTMAIYMFSCVCGSSLNLLLLIIIIEVSVMSANILLFNQAVCDFIVVVFGNSMVLVSIITGRWYWGYGMCQCYAIFMSTVGFASIGNVTAMTVERWYLVVNSSNIISNWSAIIVAAVWIYGILLSLPPMFGWGQYGNDILNITCILLWDDHDSERSNIYIAFILLVGHGLPTVIIISISVHIILTDSRRRQNLRITKMVKLTVMIYLVAWIPRVTLGIAIHYFDVKPSPIIVILTYTLSTLTICNKPIIAIYLNNQLKNCVRKMFGREVSDEAGIRNEIGMVSERNN